MIRDRTTRSAGIIRTEADIEALERHERSELIPARNTYELFGTTAALHGDRPALTILHTPEPDGPSTAYTHRSLLHELTRTANLYTALGVVAGDVVSILSRTHPEVPTAIWGAQIAGTASCINYLLAANVIAALLTSEDAKVLVCPGPDRDPEIWAKVEHLAQECACLETILVLGEIPENADPRCRSYGRLLEDESGDELLRQTLPDSTEIAALFHTGGTTGIPKLVPQSHESQIHGAWSFAQVFDLCETDTCLNGFPFFHVGGTATMGLTLMAAGGHAVILTANGFRDRGVVLNIWKLVEYFGATVLGAVPTAIGAMTNVPLADSDISTLRYMLSGGAAIPRAVADRFEAHTCVPILEQYGMTETNAAIATTPLHGWKVRGGSGLYERLGSEPRERQQAYRELFRYQLEPGLVDEIRSATKGNYVLGTERFQEEVEKMLRRRVTPGKPGRPKKAGPDPKR